MTTGAFLGMGVFFYGDSAFLGLLRNSCVFAFFALAIAVTPFLDLLDSVSGPERPGNQYRLEEQADESGLVSIEPESADAVHVLADVARENSNIKQCKQYANRTFVLVQEYHAEAEQNLDDARGQNHEIQESRILRKP